jgi:uncharacterized protein (TIGR03089 family)
MAAPPATFADLLTLRLRHGAGNPLITWYDDATAERVELSVTTYANWVAKAASLISDELGLDRGAVLRVDLPAHWLGPVFLGAAWTTGLAVAFSGDGDAVVCGPEPVDYWADRTEGPVLACSLRPLGAPFESALPTGVHDVGVEIWSQPDAFIPLDPPGPEDVALRGEQESLSQRSLWEGAAAGSLLTDGGRLLTGANPASPPGLAAFAEPLVRGGSLVVVRNASPTRLVEIAAAERAVLSQPTETPSPTQPGPS